MTTHDHQIIISAVADLELVAAEGAASTFLTNHAPDIDHSVRVINDAVEELLFRRQECEGVEARIKSLSGVAATLGADLNHMREDRDQVSKELAQAQAELRRRGSVVDVVT